jgi:hypothetical protein
LGVAKNRTGNELAEKDDLGLEDSFAQIATRDYEVDSFGYLHVAIRAD